MIAASEPVEFIPRGRLAVEEHPGPTLTKPKNFASEHLWHRMQSVNISEEPQEFWFIRDYYEECSDREDVNTANMLSSPSYMTELYINSEEELYIRGNTAVWSLGQTKIKSVNPRKCFTMNDPIKFAFFCYENFINFEKRDDEDNRKTAICFIDSTSLRVYCNNGEDHVCNLEFPVSNAWQTKYGLILEKEASNAMIQAQYISMPRFFSLSNPLDEMCPILCKSVYGSTTYLTEANYKIIFSTHESDLVFLYDKKVSKHFVGVFRKATEAEIEMVGDTDDVTDTTLQQSFSSSANMMKVMNSTKLQGRLSFGKQPSYTSRIQNNSTASQSINNPLSILNRSSIQSPLNRLHSSMGPTWMSVQERRKIGQIIPSKPIVPEYCLEHIWAEPLTGKDFCEIASTAFMHTDLTGQNYLCYLLPRSCKLHLLKLNGSSSSGAQIFGAVSTLLARDAVPLEKMKMIAILGTCGTLTLYTGSVLVTKVHVADVSPALTPQGFPKQQSSTFPRRSSLLPTIPQNADRTFDDEVHMLSPVYPLQTAFPIRLGNMCLGLRDPAGNRLTLVHSDGKMFRITLPLVNETYFVSKCLSTLQQVLSKDLSIQLFIKWYGARNALGSLDFSREQEWETFKNVLWEMLGTKISLNESCSNNSSAEEPKKRWKGELSGSDEDWEYLESLFNNERDGNEAGILHTDNNAPLFSQIPIIFYALHLLYEDIKLDPSLTEYLKYLAKFLYQLACEMQLNNYCMHYFLDFPHLLQFTTVKYFTQEDAQKMTNGHLLNKKVPNIYQQINEIIRVKDSTKYSYIPRINRMSKYVIQLVSLMYHGHENMLNWIEYVDVAGTPSSEFSRTPANCVKPNETRSQQVIQILLAMGTTRAKLESLPPALHYLFAQSLETSRISPSFGMPYQAYELLIRSELMAHSKLNKSESYDVNIEDSLSLHASLPDTSTPLGQNPAEDDGMDNVDTKLLRLRFPDDLRINEVRTLLNSSEPVLIQITQAPGVSDHEFIEEQEKQLYALCIRTMSLPMGRGMFTLRTLNTTPVECFPVPKLSLSGKEPAKGAVIEMQQMDFPMNMALWPSFHNGLAAGLKISSHTKDIDSTWIVYNKPKVSQTDVSTEHGGFLMALGLNGHLKNFSFMCIYEYLVKCDEMVSVGLLLGIAATYRGTMHTTTTKLLSVHIEALLPATALELDVPQNIQVASLMGIGLLYQGSGKGHIAEVLLQEIGRPPGPEMENSIERESYALTAGLALGLVTLGQGESSPGLRDLQLPDTLHYYMVGGNKRPLTGSQKEKYKLLSFQVREGDVVNIDITAPGATLALGLMFFNTGNESVAQWMQPPDTSYLLDLIRPDLLLLRIISRGLILWDQIEPSSEWLLKQFPTSLEFDLKHGPRNINASNDHEANAQAYCNIITGASFCIGLKYAGTENPSAFETLKKTIKLFLSTSSLYIGEHAGKGTIENCLIMVLLSMSLVCAGTGNLEILRIIRYLRSRIGSSYPQVNYGSHMGIHMALGFLFLGAGRYTLSRSPEAIAALVIALFPKFPNHSNDNRYHLQAFRHFYVLAIEPRLFLPRDIDTGKLCLCQISYIEIGSNELKNLPVAPCMLPDLNTLKTVKVNDPNYWPVTFERGRNWEQLEEMLNKCECIDVKKKFGCLSHLEDPIRLKTLLAQTITEEQHSCWKVDPSYLRTFSNNLKISNFISKFLGRKHSENCNSVKEMFKYQFLTIIFYNCIAQDKMHVFSIYLSLLDAVERLVECPNTWDIWQFKIIATVLHNESEDFLASKEILSGIIDNCEFHLEKWCRQYNDALRRFISTSDLQMFRDFSSDHLVRMSSVVTYYELTQNSVNMITINKKSNYLRLLSEFKKLHLKNSTISCIGKL